MSSNVKEKHNSENNLIIWVIPLLLSLVGFGFVAAMAELITFVWPSLQLHFYLGVFSIFITFLGYFSTAKPESPDKKRSRLPELVGLLVLSKLYTLFALPWDVFLSHLRLSRFIEANFFFAFVLLYFVWVLARTAGNLALTLTHYLVDKELKAQYDENYVGVAERENITGLKMVRLLFIPMIVLLFGVVIAEQSFQAKMAEASLLKFWINIFGGILAASTIAMSTLALYLRKTQEWERERSEIDKDLGFKWVVWSLVFVILFSLVAAILPDDLSPVYFYVPNAIKAILPFMHSGQEGRPPILEDRQSEPVIPPQMQEQQIAKNNYAFLVTIAAGLRIVLFAIILGVLVYHIYKAFHENADELPALVRNIIKTLKYFFEMLQNFFRKVKPLTDKQRKTIREQVSELFKRRKVTYNQVQVNAIRKLYAQMLIEAEEKGIRREAYRTATEFSVVLEELFPDRVAEIVDLTMLYEDARYNKDPDESTSSKAKGIFSKVLQTIKTYTRPNKG